MPSLCPVCQEQFVSWVDYHEHINLRHAAKPSAEDIRKNTASPLTKREYKGPMDKAEKSRLVARGEKRIGHHYFLGGAL